MSENEKKNEVQSCCCCKCWKIIFIAIALLAIGAVFGHRMSMKHHCRHMRGPCGYGYGMKTFWDRDGREREGSLEHKARWGKRVCGEQNDEFGQKAEAVKCKPGCTCPACSKKAGYSSDPNKTGCPMMDKKEGESEKDRK
jgi:hypothetical protein